MSVEHQVGTDGVLVNVESPKDVFEALDEMHTQILDNLGQNHSLSRILSDFMDTIVNKYDIDED